MNSARIVVLAIAIGAGGIAAYLISGIGKEAPHGAGSRTAIPTADVLVAKGDIGLGETVAPENLQWQTWTEFHRERQFYPQEGSP